jgi:hypothetical protein
VIRPFHGPRQGWSEQFRIMAAQGDDHLLDEEATDLTTWAVAEWEW